MLFDVLTPELSGSIKNVDHPFCSKSEQNGLTLWQCCFQKNSFFGEFGITLAIVANSPVALTRLKGAES